MRPTVVHTLTLASVLVPAMIADPTYAQKGREVKITPELGAVAVQHAGERMVIERNQDTGHTIDPAFAQTSRPCPPFCVQPMSLHAAVETIGEIELLDYLRRASEGDESILVIDSRTPDWVQRGTIPGARNIPWTELDPNRTAPEDIAATLQFDFGVLKNQSLWDFTNAKTLVLFCNGLWCGQSPTNIRSLLALGYPPEKLKWYRGGMQAWHQLGLTTTKPD